MKPIEFFRKEIDATLDFLVEISNPKYLTKHGQKRVDEFLKSINIISKEYLESTVPTENSSEVKDGDWNTK